MENYLQQKRLYLVLFWPTLQPVTPNYTQQDEQELNDQCSFSNGYHLNLEGKQARKHRQNFADLALQLSSTKFHTCMKETIDLFNQLMFKMS